MYKISARQSNNLLFIIVTSFVVVTFVDGLCRLRLQIHQLFPCLTNSDYYYYYYYYALLSPLLSLMLTVDLIRNT